MNSPYIVTVGLIFLALIASVSFPEVRLYKNRDFS